MAEKATTEKQETTEAKLVEIPTGSQLAVQLESGDYVDTLGLLVRIYNKLCRIEKAIA